MVEARDGRCVDQIEDQGDIPLFARVFVVSWCVGSSSFDTRERSCMIVGTHVQIERVPPSSPVPKRTWRDQDACRLLLFGKDHMYEQAQSAHGDNEVPGYKLFLYQRLGNDCRGLTAGDPCTNGTVLHEVCGYNTSITATGGLRSGNVVGQADDDSPVALTVRLVAALENRQIRAAAVVRIL